jgi:hypothetical protein
MKTMTLTTRNEKIEAFIQLFREGVEAWVKAGEILVTLVEEDPKAYDELIKACPTLNAGVLTRFEQMGRKQLHPQLLLGSSAGFAKLKRLPYSMQQRYLEEPIPLVIETAHGTDKLLVKARDMSPEQANQVFSGSRIRSEGEQKAYLAQKESEVPKHKGPAITLWSKKGGKIYFNPDVGFTPSDIAAILAQNTK